MGWGEGADRRGEIDKERESETNLTAVVLNRNSEYTKDYKERLLELDDTKQRALLCTVRLKNKSFFSVFCVF